MARQASLVRGLLILAFVVTCARAQEPVPLEHFTRSDELGTMKISPDGEYLAVTGGQHGAEFLRFINLSDPKVAAGVRAPDGLEILDFHWASSTRIVFTIAERQPGNAFTTPTGEIYAVDRNGKRQARIYGYRAGEMQTGTLQRAREAKYATAHIVSLLHGDDQNILIAEMPWRLGGDYWRYDPDAKPQITRLNVYSGKERRVDRTPLSGPGVIVDRNDQPRFTVGRDDSRRLAVAWKRTPEAGWETFELPGFRDQSVIPRRFTPDNRSILFTAVREGERYSALFQLDLAERSVNKLIDIPGTDVEDLITDFEDRETIGVTGYTDKAVYRWLLPDHPSARLQEALHKAFVGNEVTFLNHSADGRRAIVFVQSDVAPGEYLLFDTQTKQASAIGRARSWIDPERMAPKQPISLAARDGRALHGYVTRPTGPGPHPMIVLPHGGPHQIRDDWAFDSEVQLLASRGYAVLQVNFRGSAGYGMDFEIEGYGQWGAQMQDDVTDATLWAIEQKIAAPDRVCIYGASYGGYAALMGAVREPKLYRCAIGYAGVYDLELMFKSGDIPRSKYGQSYLSMALGKDAADLRARSPVHHADKIAVPVLLIHGKEDGRADYAHATSMKSALEKQGKPVEWLALRGEGHGVYDDRTRLQVYEGILKFLGTHLAPAAVTSP